MISQAKDDETLQSISSGVLTFQPARHFVSNSNNNNNKNDNYKNNTNTQAVVVDEIDRGSISNSCWNPGNSE